MFRDPRLPDRFWSKVLPVESGCWIWIGCVNETGYGYFGIENKRTRSTHRHAYMHLVGPIPEGLDLDHLCRVRDCCNPAHLEPVTRLENALRGLGGWHQASKTHCADGHPFDEANTHWRPDRLNSRDCRACKNLANRRLRAKRAGRLMPFTNRELAAVNAALESA
jgi:hypothetical protein